MNDNLRTIIFENGEVTVVYYHENRARLSEAQMRALYPLKSQEAREKFMRRFKEIFIDKSIEQTEK